jgi:hypothetical protein
VPNFRELGARIADHSPRVNDPVRLLSAAKERLPELRELADKYQLRIILLIPPALKENHAREVQELGSQLGVPVWVLTQPGEFTRDYFRDGFHLNGHGAEIFTARLSQQIRGLNVYPTASRDGGAPSNKSKLNQENVR